MEFYSDFSALISQFSYLGILLCLILGGIGFPFPEDAILLFSGLLMAHKSLSPTPTLVMVFAGLLISDLIIFSLGRHYGRRIVTHKWFGRILYSERLALIERRFSAYGTWVILVGRQLFGIRAQIILMAGIMRMPFLRFLLSDVLAALVTMGIMITAGYTGGEVFNGITAVNQNLSVALVVLFAVVFMLLILMRLRMKFGSSAGG